MDMRTCKKCGAQKPIVDFGEYRTKDGREGRRYECKTCIAARQLKQYRENKERHDAYKAKSTEKLWQETLDVYGRVCRCCGESEPDFLCIDHINDDGNKERAVLRPTEPRTFGGKTYYAWLRKNGWPQHVQLLCFNCNFAKARTRGCPHKRLKVMPNG